MGTRIRGWCRVVIAVLASRALNAAPAAEPGLLFYLSGDRGTTADFSTVGAAAPTFDREVTRIADGAKGPGLRCDDLQLLAWKAPGNIYAQRGTVSFFWRSRYPTGPTEFPIFRVAYADHSSWDMVWLRIDYNGHGFDAFVTDASLARTRVSVEVKPFPKPEEWIHLALSWDEAVGISFYVNGALSAVIPPVAYASSAANVATARSEEVERVSVYDTGLDQFGFHSRVISPHNVLSESNYVRGGDVDELRIYDRMLDDVAIARLAAGDGDRAQSVAHASDRKRELGTWHLRHGWQQTDAPPPCYAEQALTVRKIEIHDAYDLKRWWWKATDGIRETTWPGVYNRSRLPGRKDYFLLPDWDCYVESGQAITFDLPEEPWNHVEIAGAAWGKMELLPRDIASEHAFESAAESVLFERPLGQHKTFHRLTGPMTGRKIRFVNAEQEQPIGELSVYHVTAGRGPEGTASRTFRLQSFVEGEASLASLTEFIRGRFPPSERATLIGNATEGRASPGKPTLTDQTTPADSLPLVHILLPNTWDSIEGGLDGIAIDLPSLDLKPTHGEFFPLNIRVKDPLWPLRDLMDFTFSVKPGQPKMLWLDLRDRLLPTGKGLWIAVSAAGENFNASSLAGATVRLVFKSREAARREHEADRFNQMKDAFAMLVEEWPHSPKLNLWVRFEADLKDLLRVNPSHARGQQYAALSALAAPRPPFTVPEPPAGVPRWAFLQTELVDRVKKFVLWQIDHRQVAYGDFGGGISDDTDMTNLWPAVALLGCEPDKISRSLRALLDAAYRNGMFTRGLPTNQSDELHSYEEGINCLGQNLLLNHGSPRQIERAMETARGVAGLTGVNRAGHRHLRSSYFSATRTAEEEPWGRAKPQGYLIVHSDMMLVDFNGSPIPRKTVLELADGLLAHRSRGADGRPAIPAVVRFRDDQEIAWRAARSPVPFFPWHLFWGAWQWTGESRYVEPLLDKGMAGVLEVNANAMDILALRDEWTPQLRGRAEAPYRWVAGGRAAIPKAEIPTWQIDRDKKRLERIFATHLESCELIEYINTEGSLWTDRVSVPTLELQRTRLGGIALVRSALYPGHAVSWRFSAPASERSVAILIPDATPTAFTVIAHNLESVPVRTEMTGWHVAPGDWDITQGVDTNDDDVADGATSKRTTSFGRSRVIDLELPPRVTTILTCKLKTPGKPYWSRPDLGIDPEDIVFRDGALSVRIHSVGAVDSPPAQLALRDRDGGILATAAIPPLPAPLDLSPQTVEVVLRPPAGVDWSGGSIEIDPALQFEEITRLNNLVSLGAVGR